MSVTHTRPDALVLYVDDERANRVVFEQSLASEFTIRSVASGPEALEIMATEQVAVLVTDMRMSPMSGLELLRIAMERSPGTVRMVITAYSDIDPILQAINEGLVSRYIVKPWVRTELVQVLRWAIGAWTFTRDSEELHRRLLQTERLATLGSMAAMFVHDLKQPLMSLLYNSELFDELAQHAPLLRDAIAQTVLDADLREKLILKLDDLPQLSADNKASAAHLERLISALRDFSRPRGANEADPIDPLPIVRHAMSVCQRLVINARASIGYLGPNQLPRVRISQTDLTQVLINIVANSAQAVAARGSPNGSVSIVAHAEQGMLELQVKDDGVGIQPENLNRIGTPFFTTRTEGTGLGLTQCHRLIGTAGGRLRIESEPGVGTTVTIILPTAA